MEIMNYTYLVLNLIILAVPLALSFHHTLKFYRKWGRVAFSILTIGGFYILWDIVFTRLSVWSFSNEYTTKDMFTIAGLPIGELLFFITVPFACLFIYEAVKYHLPKFELKYPAEIVQYAIILLLPIIAVFFVEKTYTLVVLASVVGTVVIQMTLTKLSIIPDLFRNSSYWLFLGFSYIGFILINFILTSLPVVIYNSQEFSNMRLLTIPVEDFFYNFSLLTLYLIAYLVAGKLNNDWQ